MRQQPANVETVVGTVVRKGPLPPLPSGKVSGRATSTLQQGPACSRPSSPLEASLVSCVPPTLGVLLGVAQAGEMAPSDQTGSMGGLPLPRYFSDQPTVQSPGQDPLIVDMRALIYCGDKGMAGTSGRKAGGAGVRRPSAPPAGAFGALSSSQAPFKRSSLGCVPVSSQRFEVLWHSRAELPRPGSQQLSAQTGGRTQALKGEQLLTALSLDACLRGALERLSQ